MAGTSNVTPAAHWQGGRLSNSSFSPKPSKSFRRLSRVSISSPTMADSAKKFPLGLDATTVDEYTFQSKLLQEFTNLPTIDKAWVFKSDSETRSRAMFSVGQVNLSANKKKTLILSSHISKENKSVSFEWSPFPIEMIGVSKVIPSPSGSKLLVVRNKENGTPTKLEIWCPTHLVKEIHIPESVHGPLYTDGWFEGVSWNNEETLIAYVAEEPTPSKPSFDGLGFRLEDTSKKDCGSWRAQGDWEEDWGETYSGKGKPELLVLNTNSGEVQAVKGIAKSLSVGQVVWAPLSSQGFQENLVFVGWTCENGPQASIKLGIKYCYNRPCALYVVRAPFQGSSAHVANLNLDETEDSTVAVKLTPNLSSAFFPRFSPDGKFLVFLSAKSAVDTGAHWATNSIHRMDWSSDAIPGPFANIVDVVPIVMRAEDGCFPGLYCSKFLDYPWLSDGCTIVTCSFWGSMQVIILIHVLSGRISRVSPSDSNHSWDILALDGDNILAVSSSPKDPPQVKYGFPVEQTSLTAWNWLCVSSPFMGYPEEVRSLLSSLQFSIMKIPVSEASENLTEGARKPFESIFVSSSKSQSKAPDKVNLEDDACNPLIVIVHGGPHSVSLSSYSKSLAFLASLGYNLLIVNYRGSLGFGEEALQSLPGKIGCQDVNDVLTAVDCVIEKGLADPSKIAVLGGSHGGFLTTHLIGQAPEKFAVAAVRNPVCNLSLMVGTSDIPDWCYVEAYGQEGRNIFTLSPSVEHLSHLYAKSPISHLSKVKTPILFLLGAKDLRVPISNGLQYARALKEKGGEVKVIVFPNDTHGIERPQSDFESYLNIGVWFKKYCK